MSRREDRQTDRDRDELTDRQAGRQAGRQEDRPTDRQTEMVEGFGKKENITKQIHKIFLAERAKTSTESIVHKHTTKWIACHASK